MSYLCFTSPCSKDRGRTRSRALTPSCACSNNADRYLESVYLVHIQTFVVAAGEVQMLWIHHLCIRGSHKRLPLHGLQCEEGTGRNTQHLEGEEQQHDLKRERTAIDEIAVEKIRVVLGRISW